MQVLLWNQCRTPSCPRALVFSSTAQETATGPTECFRQRTRLMSSCVLQANGAIAYPNAPEFFLDAILIRTSILCKSEKREGPCGKSPTAYSESDRFLGSRRRVHPCFMTDQKWFSSVPPWTSSAIRARRRNHLILTTSIFAAFAPLRRRHVRWTSKLA